MKEFGINHLYKEIKEEVMRRDNLQLLLLLFIVGGTCATKAAEKGEVPGDGTLPLSSRVSNRFSAVLFAHFFLLHSL